MLHFLLNLEADLAAHSDFECPTFGFLNKNYLFKFEISIWSSSVRVILPDLSVAKPIKANYFINSQPKAPAPIIKQLIFETFSWYSIPNKEI